MLHCRLLEMPRPAIGRRAADDALWRPSASPARADDKVGTFSKGMQQRLGLGVALLGESGARRPRRADERARPGRSPRRARDHPRAARTGHDGVSQHPPARGGRAGLRPRRRDRPAARRSRRVRSPSCSAARTTVRLEGRRAAATWWRLSCAGLGRWSREGEWVVVRDVPPGGVPDLVATSSSWGGRVEAVVPEHQSLEDRFLELLGEPMSAILTVAALTIREAVRRKLVAAFALITVGLVAPQRVGVRPARATRAASPRARQRLAPAGAHHLHVHVQLRRRPQRFGDGVAGDRRRSRVRGVAGDRREAAAAKSRSSSASGSGWRPSSPATPRSCLALEFAVVDWVSGFAPPEPGPRCRSTSSPRERCCSRSSLLSEHAPLGDRDRA